MPPKKRPPAAAAGSRPSVAATGSRPKIAAAGTQQNTTAAARRPNIATAGSQQNTAAAGSRPNITTSGSQQNTAAAGTRPNIETAGRRRNGDPRPIQNSQPRDSHPNAAFPSPQSNPLPAASPLQAVRRSRQTALNEEDVVPVVVQQTGSMDPNAYHDFDNVMEAEDQAPDLSSPEEALGSPPSTPSVHGATETVQTQQRPPTQVFMGGCSNGSGIGEDVPVSFGTGLDIRTTIRPAGETFDNPAAGKLIGQRCIPTCFEPGWTTIETIPSWAVDRWFKEFKTLVKWNPDHTLAIYDIFRRKAAKTVSEGFGNMRSGKTKGPKWANPDVRKAAKQIYATSEIFKKRSIQNRQNYLGLKSGNGPSKHLGGSKDYDQHLQVLENELQRQVMPGEMYQKLKVRKDGSFVETNGESTLKKLEAAEKAVRDKHPDASTLPIDELYDATREAYGKIARTGRPRLFGKTSALNEGSKYSQTCPSVSSCARGSTNAEDLEQIVARTVAATLTQQMEQFFSRYMSGGNTVQTTRPRSHEDEDEGDAEGEDDVDLGGDEMSD